MSVYFAKVGPYIKIGFSENPERRVRRLFASTTRYSCPPDTPLDLASRHLIRYIDGDKSTEFQIHRALSDFCVGTEWFVDEPEVRDFIHHAPAEMDDAYEYEKVVRPTGPAPLAWEPTEEEDSRCALIISQMLSGGAPLSWEDAASRLADTG